jgi:hypothetical protein
MRLRLFIVFLTLCASIAGAPSEREVRLAALKEAFPAHVAGAVTERSDPLIRECYFGYKKIVEQMTLDTLPRDVGRLRERTESEIVRYREQLDLGREMKTPSMKHAVQQNLAWLTQKMRPYVARLESFQRGRLP